MWDEDKQRHFDELRQRARHTALTAEEQQMLDLLLLDLERAEWAALRPGLSRLQHEQGDLQVDLDQVQARNVALASLAERYADLLARAKVQLEDCPRNATNCALNMSGRSKARRGPDMRRQ